MPSFAKMVTIQSTSFIINTIRIGAAHLMPSLTSWRSPAQLTLKLGYFWWCCLSVRPPFGDIPETRVLVRFPIPHKIFIQSSSGWEALAGEEEPGGREEQRSNGEGKRVFKMEGHLF